MASTRMQPTVRLMRWMTGGFRQPARAKLQGDSHFSLATAAIGWREVSVAGSSMIPCQSQPTARHPGCLGVFYPPVLNILPAFKRGRLSNLNSTPAFKKGTPSDLNLLPAFLKRYMVV